MAKYHITKAGKPAQCNATVNDCPLGGEHYESPQEAMEAINEAELGGAKEVEDPLVTKWREELNANTNKELRLMEAHCQEDGWQKDLVEAELAKRQKAGTLEPETTRQARERYTYIDRDKLVAPEDREQFYKFFIEDIERDPRGDGIAGFIGDGPINELRGMSDSEFQQLKDAQTKPLRLKPKDKKAINAMLEESGVSMEEADAWIGVNHPLPLQLRGESIPMHPNRGLWIKTIGSSFTAEYAKVIEAVAYDKANPTKAKETPLPDINESSNHYHGLWGGSAAEEVTSAPKPKKELDPQMIEALKLKYLKKFKVPFSESGLSVPELLQMAQKGELD